MMMTITPHYENFHFTRSNCNPGMPSPFPILPPHFATCSVVVTHVTRSPTQGEDELQPGQHYGITIRHHVLAAHLASSLGYLPQLHCHLPSIVRLKVRKQYYDA